MHGKCVDVGMHAREADVGMHEWEASDVAMHALNQIMQ
jgi:hypothetical protein